MLSPNPFSFLNDISKIYLKTGKIARNDGIPIRAFHFPTARYVGKTRTFADGLVEMTSIATKINKVISADIFRTASMEIPETYEEFMMSNRIINNACSRELKNPYLIEYGQHKFRFQHTDKKYVGRAKMVGRANLESDTAFVGYEEADHFTKKDIEMTKQSVRSVKKNFQMVVIYTCNRGVAGTDYEKYCQKHAPCDIPKNYKPPYYQHKWVLINGMGELFFYSAVGANDMLPDDLKDQCNNLLKTGPEMARVVVYGEAGISGGNMFELHKIKRQIDFRPAIFSTALDLGVVHDKTAMTLQACDANYGNEVVLKEGVYDPQEKGRMDPVLQSHRIAETIENGLKMYGINQIELLVDDNMETYMPTLRVALSERHLEYNVIVKKCTKMPIGERTLARQLQIAQGRFYISLDCPETYKEYSMCVEDPDKRENGLRIPKAGNDHLIDTTHYNSVPVYYAIRNSVEYAMVLKR